MRHESLAHRLAPLAAAATVAGSLGAQTPADPAMTARPPRWEFDIVGSERARGESWSWFAPAAGFDGSYTMWSSVLRLGAAATSRHLDLQLDLTQPWLGGLPENAVATAPQGQLGFGGTYRAVNSDRSTDVFVKQGFVRLKTGTAGQAWSLRLGRFEFGDARETIPLDATVAALKRDRLADRLIGSFTFPAVGRSFDGLEGIAPVAGATVTALAAHPTQGVFNLDGMPELAIDLGYLSLSRQVFGRDVKGKSTARGEIRLFGQYYRDRRAPSATNVKVDNRPDAARVADGTWIRIVTVGGHFLSVHRAGGGEVDLLAWAVLQTGSWGLQNHRAGALALEGGYRFSLAGIRPWLRTGYYRGSGDADPADTTHGSFFGVVPTPRLYARFPFFNLMNVEDVFGQLLLHLPPRLVVRADVHRLRLAEAGDLWYAGGGAFEDRTFGYVGRPGGGGRSLATLIDLSADFRLLPRTSISLYVAHAIGGEVVQAVHPRGHRATYLYLELVETF